MSKKFEAGQTVYSEQGERAEYVTASGDGHIVRPIVEDCGYDGDSGPYDHVCDPVIWRHVFHQEPVAKFSDELKVLHEKIAAARAERSQMQAEEYALQRARAEKLKRFAVLDSLEAFIDGKITHYVTRETYTPPQIIAVEQALTGDSDRHRGVLRLLTLGGCLKTGGINWQLNQYSDGSGSATGVIPCTSLEQAQEIVKQEAVKHFAGSRRQDSERQEWIDAAEKLGVDVPDAYRRTVAAVKLRQLEENGHYTRRQAEQYNESVARMDAELVALRDYLATPAGAA
jgi:hypothetical protein